ncbi:MAG: MBL fold metallo-hydrolase [Desulfobacterales bacterium]
MNRPIIKQIPAGPFQVLTYLVACPKSRNAVIIDPAGDEDKILAVIQTEYLRVKYILNTHGHADHVLGNHKLKSLLNVPVGMHEADDTFFADPDIREISSQELGMTPADPADIRLKDKDVLEMGTIRIEVIHTPGHTPGSVCYLVGENLFSGDTLFVGAAGRTDLVGGSLDTLIESIEKKLIVLPKQTILWPGHDYGESPTSTIGREMEENPYITDFILV